MQEPIFDGVMHMDFESNELMPPEPLSSCYVPPGATSSSSSNDPSVVINSVRLSIINLEHTMSFSSEVSIPMSSYTHLVTARHHLKLFEEEMLQVCQHPNTPRQHTPENRGPSPSQPYHHSESTQMPFQQNYTQPGFHNPKFQTSRSQGAPIQNSQAQHPPPHQHQPQFQFQPAYNNPGPPVGPPQNPQLQPPPPHPQQPMNQPPYPYPPNVHHPPQAITSSPTRSQQALKTQSPTSGTRDPRIEGPPPSATAHPPAQSLPQSPLQVPQSPSGDLVTSLEGANGSPFSDFPNSPYAEEWQKGNGEKQPGGKAYADIKVFKAPVNHSKAHQKNTRRVPSVLSNTQASTMMYQFSLNEGRSSRKRGRGNSSKSNSFYTSSTLSSLTGSFSNTEEEDVNMIPGSSSSLGSGSSSSSLGPTPTSSKALGSYSGTVISFPQEEAPYTSNSITETLSGTHLGNEGEVLTPNHVHPATPGPTSGPNNFNSGGFYNQSAPVLENVFHTQFPGGSTANFSGNPNGVPAKDSPLNNLEVLDMIGAGTYGTVHLARHKVDNNYYCLKRLKRQTIFRHKQTEHVQNEKTILKNISYPGIVKLYSTFNDSEHLYFLMEYVPGGELFTYIRKFGHLSEPVAKFFVAEIVIILDFLHGMNIIYRDLKPENILLDVKGHVKLTDFGFSKVVTDRTWTMCGTPDYLAPEIISCTGHNKSVDWWSLGILIFEMMMGYPPFRDENTLKLFQKICDPSMLIIPETLGKEVRDLLLRLLVINPTHRLGSGHRGILEITDHPWFQEVDWSVVAKREGYGPIVPVVQGPNDVSNYLCHPVAMHDTAQDVPIPEEVQQIFDNF